MSDLIEKNLLIDLIYEAAEDLELWPKLLDEIDKMNGEGSGVPQPLSASLSSSLQIDQDYWVHIQRAFRLAQKMADVRDESGAVKHFLRRLPVGVIDVAKDGSLIDSNEAANAIVRESDNLEFRDGIFSATNQADAKNIENARQSVLAGNKNVFVHISERANSSLTIHAIRSNSGDLKKNYCTFLLTAGNWQTELSEQELKEKYKLTPAEIRLSKHLVQGLTLAEIAEEIGVRINTVRNQLKSIFSKTGTSRQSELVSRLLSSQVIGKNDNPDNKSSIAYDFPAPESFKIYTTEDASQINYFEFGSATGKPVIYMHDFVLWNWWTILGENFFIRNNIRLIILIRPGYFKSSLPVQFSFQTWSNHVEELFDQLQLKSFYCLGFSSGCAFASALAYYLPKRCSRLSLVSGYTSFEKLSDLKSVQPSITRMLLAFARYAPGLYKTMLSNLLATAYAKNRDYVKDYIAQWSDYDRKKMDIPCYLESFNASFRAIAESNLDGLANDGVIGAKKWGYDFDCIPVKTDVWRGSADQATSQYLSRKLDSIPNAQVNVIKGVGHLLIVDYAEPILSSLLETEIS